MLDNDYEPNERFENPENHTPQQNEKDNFSANWEPARAFSAVSSENMEDGETARLESRIKEVKIAVYCTLAGLAGVILGVGILYGVGQIPGTTAQVNPDNPTVQQVSVKAIASPAKASMAEIYAANVDGVSINCSVTANYFGQFIPCDFSGSGLLIADGGYTSPCSAKRIA